MTKTRKTDDFLYNIVVRLTMYHIDYCQINDTMSTMCDFMVKVVSHTIILFLRAQYHGI